MSIDLSSFSRAPRAAELGLQRPEPVEATALRDNAREPLVLASRNLGNVILVAAESVNVYTLMKGDKVVITSAGLKALGQRLAKKKER